MFDYTVNPKLDANNDKLIRSEIKKLTTGYNNLKYKTHIILLACMEHAVKHTDASLVTLLYNQLPNTVNKSYIGEWLKTFTTLQWKKNKAGEHMWLGTNKKCEWKDKEKAEAIPFYEMEGSGDPKPDAWTLFNAIEQAFKKANSRKEKSKLSQREIELLNRLAPMYTEVSSKLSTKTAVPSEKKDNVRELQAA